MISAKFQADFTSFEEAVKKADVTLKTLVSDADKVPASLARIGNSLQGTKLIQDATMMADAVQRIGGVAVLTEKELQRVGAQAQEAAEKMQKLGIGVPENLQQIADAAKAAQKPMAEMQTSGLDKWFGNLSQQIVSTAAGFLSAQTILNGVSGAYRTLTGFVADSVKAYATAEAAQVKLTAALKAQGDATPEVIDQYNKLATQFEKTTVFSDDLITSMEALLVQVGDVMPQDMEKALKASTDLAAGLGIELEQATMIVAKAAAGHTETLGRYGITVDKAAYATKGFDAVLDSINKQFGGQAVAQIDTYAGKVQQIANAWDNVQEAVGKAIANDPILQAGLRTLNDTLGGTADSAGKADTNLASLITTLGNLGPASGVVLGFLELWARDANDAAAAMERLRAAGLKPEPSHLPQIAPVASHLPAGTPDPGFVEGLRQGSDAMDAIHEAFKKFRDEHVEAELKKQEEAWKQWTKGIEDATIKMHLSTFALNRWASTLPGVTSGLQAVRDQWEGWVEPLDGVAVGIKLTADQIEGLMRAGQFATVRMAELNAQLLKLPDVHSSLEGADVALKSAAYDTTALHSALESVDTVLSGINSEWAQMATVAARTVDTVIAKFSSGDWIGGIAAGVAGGIDLITKIGAPSAAEKEGRQVVKTFEEGFKSTADMINKVGAAYIALGKTAEDAQRDIKAMWDAEKRGADATKAAVDKVQEALDRQKMLAQGAAKFGPSKTELEQLAKDAKDVYDYMLDQGTFTADQLAAAFKASQEAQAEALGINTAATKKHLDEMQKGLEDLMQRRDALWTQVSQEAPEEVMGVIETAQRAQLGVLDDQIAAQKSAIEKEAADAADALERALGGITPDTIHVPVVFDFANAGDFSYRGEAPEPFPMARGGDFLVTKPTLFIAGDAGPERATFQPLGRSAAAPGESSVLSTRLASLERTLTRLPRTISRAVTDGLVGITG